MPGPAERERVAFTPVAVRQLDQLHAYVSLRAGEAIADGYADRIIAFCRRLRLTPFRGTKRDYLLPGLRSIGFERRVTIVYTVTDDAVMIEGIFYGGRNYERFFQRRRRRVRSPRA